MGAYRIQRRIGRVWVSRLCCAIGVLGFVAFAALFAYISYGTKSFADALRNPRPALQVPANWAPNMSAPDRTKYSRYFAQAAFRERGELLKYIDAAVGWWTSCLRLRTAFMRISLSENGPSGLALRPGVTY